MADRLDSEGDGRLSVMMSCSLSASLGKMKSFTKSTQITWALIWRSTLLAPFFLVFYVLAAASWAARFTLPVLILISAWFQDWLFVAVYGITCLLSIGLWRWGFRNFWEAPPSLL